VIFNNYCYYYYLFGGKFLLFWAIFGEKNLGKTCFSQCWSGMRIGALKYFWENWKGSLVELISGSQVD
jgi:hypothetical protein